MNRRINNALAGVVALGLSFALCVGLAGCSKEDKETSDAPAELEIEQEQTQVSLETIPAATQIDESLYDLEYSESDQDSTFEQAKGIVITLSDGSAQIDGEGASFTDGVVTIGEEGVYFISGSLDEGQIVVEAADDEDVHLVLSAVDISCSTGPALFVKQADKCIVTLYENSSSSLSDGADYSLEGEDDDAGGAIYSYSDISFNGSGSLSLDGNKSNGIFSKDDVVICGGSYDISAVNNGIHGKDSVKVASGRIDIEAGKDGIKSSQDSDESKGFVSLDGGSADIKAQDDGIQAYNYVRISGCSVAIEAADDGINSDGVARMAGGELGVTAGDDGFHAENVLEMDDGSAQVSQSVEGFEAQEIYINGGQVSIIASDDGFNASQSDGVSEDENDADDRDTTPEMAQGGMMGDTSEDCLLQINDGYVVVDAQGDGLDSNGYVEINGGSVLVNGPENDGNGALDYGLSSSVSDGIVMLIGSMGMAESFQTCEQACINAEVSGNAGDTVAVCDSSGKVLVSLVAKRAFAFVQASCPDMADGQEYNVVVGGSVQGANDDGFASSGTAEGGTYTTVSASTEAYHISGSMMNTFFPGNQPGTDPGQQPEGAQPSQPDGQQLAQPEGGQTPDAAQPFG